MIDNFNELLENANKIAISGHIRPDGDCVGSCLAMYNYITTYYSNTEVHVYLDPIPNIFKFLKNADKIEDIHTVVPETVFDLYIALDCNRSKLSCLLKFQIGLFIYQASKVGLSLASLLK